MIRGGKDTLTDAFDCIVTRGVAYIIVRMPNIVALWQVVVIPVLRIARLHYGTSAV